MESVHALCRITKYSCFKCYVICCQYSFLNGPISIIPCSFPALYQAGLTWRKFGSACPEVHNMVRGLVFIKHLYVFSRLLFRSSSTAMEWAQRNKYFHLLLRGVEQDGWRFVLLARFSPIPSYVINYALAATNVGFLLDFLLPTVIGCVPMILQNTSIGSLAGAAVATASGTSKSRIWSFVFPLLGIFSSILISLRIKSYSSSVVANEPSGGLSNEDKGSTSESSGKGSQDLKKIR